MKLDVEFRETRQSFAAEFKCAQVVQTGAPCKAGENIEIDVVNGAIMATLTLSGTGYDYIYPGTGDEAEKDNTRPITSAGVYLQIGNINALLETI